MRKSIYLWAVSILALFAFLWPFWAYGLSIDAGILQLLVVPAIVVCVGAAFLLLEGDLIGPKQVAMLGVLASLGAAVRVASAGAGGFELVFAIVILGGAAYGARFGFLLGAVTIVVSSLFFGGIGPWTPFQIFAVAWVGAAAGWISKRTHKSIPALAIYSVFASYLFGILMNAWFWPFATGFDSSISYSPTLNGVENLSNFLVYSLLSSTFSWDTVRAVSVSLFILFFGKAILRSFERAKV